MDYNLTAVQQGMTLATQRYLATYNEPAPNTLDIQTEITNAIDVYEAGERYLDRYVTLYVEIIGFAQLVRTHNNETRLNREELIAAFSFIAYLMNSFKHD